MRKIHIKQFEPGIFVLTLIFVFFLSVGNALAQQQNLSNEDVDNPDAITQMIEQVQDADIADSEIDILEPEFKTIEPIETTGPSAPLYLEYQELNPESGNVEILEPEFKTIEPVEGTGPSAPIYREEKEINPQMQNIPESENLDDPETMENQ